MYRIFLKEVGEVAAFKFLTCAHNYYEHNKDWLGTRFTLMLDDVNVTRFLTEAKDESN